MNLSLITRHGVFSTADARTMGLTDNDLKRLVGSGECVRLTRGWYAPAIGPLDPIERHRLTALALGREYCGRAALSHSSAVVAQRIATHAVDLSKVHLTLGARRGHEARAIAGHSAGDPRRADGLKAPGVSTRRKGLVLQGRSAK
ncbi:type IV toxin-antitoxin system AbiEi family antitoxin domain-containing protein [Intrasporangium sp.]|uniref:type IV toxin-antitoxin system AbiEi family antitoxin domain-containing protein n=1 Tax=Intrasporangium sp. TaxID=1925024 RepID=UPI00293A27F3|nr:type IV toxin-antitoxin system AbiEi family antitoxin domain-containing protein [Intrasporangium sp.]MDV3221370.1 type IV toxin-antitoxin system AbiEi family antitoxin domain-containing protein [Intrasporangium sp.]